MRLLLALVCVFALLVPFSVPSAAQQAPGLKTTTASTFAPLATVTAAEFVKLCAHIPDYRVTGTLKVVGGTGEITEDCTFQFADGAKLLIIDATIHSDDCEVDPSGASCRFMSKAPGGDKATLEIRDSTIDVKSYVALTASSAAGRFGGTVKITGSAVSGSVVGVTAGSFAGGPGSVVLKGSELTARDGWSFGADLQVSSGDRGAASITRSKLTAMGSRGININAALGSETSKTKVTRTEFQSASGIIEIDGSPCALSRNTGLSVSCLGP